MPVLRGEPHCRDKATGLSGDGPRLRRGGPSRRRDPRHSPKEGPWIKSKWSRTRQEYFQVGWSCGTPDQHYNCSEDLHSGLPVGFRPLDRCLEESLRHHLWPLPEQKGGRSRGGRSRIYQDNTSKQTNTEQTNKIKAISWGASWGGVVEKSCFLRSLNKLNLTPGLEVRELGSIGTHRLLSPCHVVCPQH